jgi:serine/threonine protein kinase
VYDARVSSLHPGDRIADRYRVESVIATGGMGAVYRALDERLARPVAVKVILDQLGGDTNGIARFEREAITSARLSHPGIVNVHDFATTSEGMRYLVMELVEGRTLAKVLEDGRLSPSRAVDVVEQALVALGAAHAAGIVHRDLKPANLMIVPLDDGRDLVKILDFGIAQLKAGEVYTRLTRTGDVLGTPMYMAPEQARAEPLDARTDVYAMGLVLWTCLTGERPWPSDYHVAQLLIAVQTELPPRADTIAHDVPKAVASVAQKAIAKRVEDRYASAGEMLTALRDAARALPPDTRLPPPATEVHLVRATPAVDTEATLPPRPKTASTPIATAPSMTLREDAESMPAPLVVPVGEPAASARSGCGRWIAVSSVLVVVASIVAIALIGLALLALAAFVGWIDLSS